MICIRICRYVEPVQVSNREWCRRVDLDAAMKISQCTHIHTTMLGIHMSITVAYAHICIYVRVCV